MVQPLTNAELTEATRSLEMQFKQIAAPYEDALSNRVFHSVQQSIKMWITVWLGFLSVVFALIAYVGYEELVSAGKRTIEEQVGRQVTSQLQDEINAELKKTRELVKKTLLENSLNDISKLDTDLARVIDDTQTAVDARIQEFATKLGTVTRDPSVPEKLQDRPSQINFSGFAYFGIRSGGDWSERNFDIRGKPANSMPEAGDIVVAKIPVNARTGMIEMTERGWVNKPTVGLIRPSQPVQVKSVMDIGGTFIWFEFTPAPQR